MFWQSKSELWDYVLSQCGLSPIILRQKCVRRGLEGRSEVPQLQSEHAVAAGSEHQQQRVSPLLLWLWTPTSEQQQLAIPPTPSPRHKALRCHLVGEKRAQDGVADHRAEVDRRDGY